MMAEQATPRANEPQASPLAGQVAVLGVAGGQLLTLLAEQVAEAGGHLIGVDAKLPTLQRFRQGNTSLRVHLLQAEWLALPFAPNSLDLLATNGILRELGEEEIATFLQTAWQLLRRQGELRVSDLVEPSEAPYNEAWKARNAIVRRIAEALRRETALYVDLKRLAILTREAGFRDLAVSLLPGYKLTDAWLEETIDAVRAMASRVPQRDVRERILHRDLERLVAAYKEGDQRAAERFVLRGSKA